MRTFHSLKVREVRPETTDCVSIALDIPGALRETFHFSAGQYLTIRHSINGEDVRRSYSLCSAPPEGEWRVAVKKVPGGRFSTFANGTLKAGDTLEVMPPMGNFVLPANTAEGRHCVAFAAGSGITPILSILKTVLKEEPQSRFTLIYGNSRTDTIVFLEELEALKNTYLGRLAIHHVLSREFPGSDLFYGRITGEKCDLLVEKLPELSDADEFFLCGPNEMLESVRKSLGAHGIPEERIHFERFSAEGLPVPEKRTVQAGNQFDVSVEITQDGNTFSFTMDSMSETLLDAAQKAGADLPFACKGGVCCTCMAKLLEGKVDMAVNYALEPDQVEQGFILTCQSYPLTDTVKIDFD